MDNIESITSNVRFDFIIVTAVVNIGACGAVPAVAPKRTGSGPGIVTIVRSLAIGILQEYRLNC